LALKSDTGTAYLDVQNGRHTILAPVTLHSDLAVTVQNELDTLTVAPLLQGDSGTQKLTKSGSGTLVMTGVHTYTGATTVQGGTLELNGTLASAVMVNAGATLSGTNGVVNNSATIEGAISPGGSGVASTITTVSQTWRSGGVYNVDVRSMPAGNDYDLLAIAGDITAENGFTIRAGGSLTSEDLGTQMSRWLIASADSGSFNSSHLTLDTAGFAAEYRRHFSLVEEAGTGGSRLYLQYAAVPEAGTMMFGVMAVMPLLAHRRRKVVETPVAI
jgi:autotransporter-associated beta strand protein